MNTFQNPPYIVCAAIRADDGEILVGIRHYSPDMVNQMLNHINGIKFQNRKGDDQGFVDQFGNYLTRKEAWEIAMNNGQIRHELLSEDGMLYTEHLY